MFFKKRFFDPTSPAIKFPYVSSVRNKVFRLERHGQTMFIMSVECTVQHLESNQAGLI